MNSPARELKVGVFVRTYPTDEHVDLSVLMTPSHVPNAEELLEPICKKANEYAPEMGLFLLPVGEDNYAILLNRPDFRESGGGRRNIEHIGIVAAKEDLKKVVEERSLYRVFAGIDWDAVRRCRGFYEFSPRAEDKMIEVQDYKQAIREGKALTYTGDRDNPPLTAIIKALESLEAIDLTKTYTIGIENVNQVLKVQPYRAIALHAKAPFIPEKTLAAHVPAFTKPEVARKAIHDLLERLILEMDALSKALSFVVANEEVSQSLQQERRRLALKALGHIKHLKSLGDTTEFAALSKELEMITPKRQLNSSAYDQQEESKGITRAQVITTILLAVALGLIAVASFYFFRNVLPGLSPEEKTKTEKVLSTPKKDSSASSNFEATGATQGPIKRSKQNP